MFYIRFAHAAAVRAMDKAQGLNKCRVFGPGKYTE